MISVIHEHIKKIGHLERAILKSSGIILKVELGKVNKKHLA